MYQAFKVSKHDARAPSFLPIYLKLFENSLIPLKYIAAQPNFNLIVGEETPQEEERESDFENDTTDTYFSRSHLYTSETLAIAVTTAIVTSLVVGFMSGYIFAKRYRSEIECDAGPIDDYRRFV